jgi:putative ABC transport system substrate-binding protein
MTPAGTAFAFAALIACLAQFGTPAFAADEPPASHKRVGVLLAMYSQESKEAQAFRQGLRDAGYSEGRDLMVEWRSANGDYALVPQLVTNLIRSKVDVIVVDSTVGTRAAKRATSTIPIVMATIADPLGTGLVPSLAHPGGNVTGLSVMTTDLSAKRLQLMKEAIPGLTRVGVLWNPDTPYHTNAVKEIKTAALALSINLSLAAARTPDQISAAFTTFNKARAQALYVIVDPFFFNRRESLLASASKARLPVIYGERNFAEAGAFMSYGPNFSALFRRASEYVDKILKGATPGELPIGQPTQFELVVNLNTANVLGITIPESILVRADELIR